MEPSNTPNQSIANRCLQQRRGRVLSHACPSRNVLKHVTSQWGVLVLFALMQGTQRFSDLRRTIEGISEKMLAQTLKTLQHDGFVTRHPYEVVPPHVEYQLSPMGLAVGQKVADLAHWIEANLEEIMQHQPR